MKKIDIDKVDLFKLVSEVNIDVKPITIVNDKGKNVVLISEEYYKSISKTLGLANMSNYQENIKNENNMRKGIKQL